MMHVISLGAGVQSSTMALMAAHGEITPMPDCAIFADTGWEPKQVYEYLAWLETKLPFPIHHVSKGDLRKEQITARMRSKKTDAGARWTSLPYYTQDTEGKMGMVRRQCTSEYKIYPIEKKCRELIGLKPRQRAPKRAVITQWRGISLDEAHRQKPSQLAWYQTRFPLIEMGMTRGDCLAWTQRMCYPTPHRSSCLGCPFHSDAEWLAIKRRPDEWADVVEFDRAIRKAGGVYGNTFLHRSCKPLDEVNLNENVSDLFGEECAGVCGV